MGGCAPRRWLACHVLAALSQLGRAGYMGADLAGALDPAECPGQARMDPGLPGRQRCAGEKGGSGVGTTKGGKGSKVMVVADGHGLPMGLYVDSAQPHESQLVDATLATGRVPQHHGRPRTRPQTLVADKAYDSHDLRQRLRRRGIKPTTPTFERRQRRTPKRGRPIKTGESYRQRWKVERCFGWMDHCRRLVVRYERAVEPYQAFCLLAIILWCVNLILK